MDYYYTITLVFEKDIKAEQVQEVFEKYRPQFIYYTNYGLKEAEMKKFAFLPEDNVELNELFNSFYFSTEKDADAWYEFGLKLNGKQDSGRIVAVTPSTHQAVYLITDHYKQMVEELITLFGGLFNLKFALFL